MFEDGSSASHRVVFHPFETTQLIEALYFQISDRLSQHRLSFPYTIRLCGFSGR
jgi:hypothetical protein